MNSEYIILRHEGGDNAGKEIERVKLPSDIEASQYVGRLNQGATATNFYRWVRATFLEKF